MNKSAGKEFENKIKDLLRSKFTGFKRYGAISGTLAGGGIGGTMGLMDAVKRDNGGEMEGMETKQKLKEYLKSMLVPGAAGMAGGAVLGTGAGELLKRLRVHQTMRGMQGDIGKALAGNKKIKYTPNQILERAASGYPEQNVLKHIGDKFKSILGKRAEILDILHKKEKNTLEKEGTSFGATRKLLRYLRSQGLTVTRDADLLAEKLHQAVKLPKKVLRADLKATGPSYSPETSSVYIPKKLNGVVRLNSRMNEYGARASKGSRLQEGQAGFADVIGMCSKGGRRTGRFDDLLHYSEDYSPRSALFHEGGHAMHHLDDPRMPEIRASMLAPNTLALERIANNNAINFMKQHNAPSSHIDQYRRTTDNPYGNYLGAFRPKSTKGGKYVPSDSLRDISHANPAVSPKNWL